MNYSDIKSYIESLPVERQEVINRLRQVILDHLPEGFEETISYNMIGYVVPHSLYPAGYHCDPKLPLPFINLASQKNYVSFYHMGIYADEALMKWFTTAYKETCQYKLDMGKSCIRFKHLDDIPYELIGDLVSKISPQQWIKIYDEAKAKNKK